MSDIARCENIRQLIIDSSISASNQLSIAGSPQARALDWLCVGDAYYVCPYDGECFVNQRYILAVIYFSTNGENWSNCSNHNGDCDPVSLGQPGYNPNGSSRWLDPIDECEWYGLRCSLDKCLRVAQIENINQTGYIPSETSYLTDLRYLAMEDGGIKGIIPNNIGNLSQLIVLDLDAQELSGNIPESVFKMTTLTTLDLNQNNLTGTISPLIGNLVDLTFLQVDHNLLTGLIPNAFHNTTNLGKATFESNYFSGVLPASLCDLQMDVLQADCMLCVNNETPFTCCSGCY